MKTQITLQEWLDALRSGEWVQGTNNLKFYSTGGYCYCCLGVGTALTCGFIAGNRNAISQSSGFAHRFISDLPDAMWEVYSQVDHTIRAKYGPVNSLNDGGWTFSQIADAVEARARELGWTPEAVK